MTIISITRSSRSQSNVWPKQGWTGCQMKSGPTHSCSSPRNCCLTTSTWTMMKCPRGIWRIRRDGFKSVAEAETAIMSEVTYGACCVDDFSAKALDCDLILPLDNAVARDWIVEVSRTRSLSSPSRHPAKGHVYRTRPTQHHGGWGGAAQNMKSSSTSINPRR